MTHPGDELREIFAEQEQSIPDPAAFYAQVQQLARKYRRRRLGGQIAGGAVLSAGLVAGVLNMPALLPQSATTSVIGVAPASSTAAPASKPPNPKPSRSWTQDEMFDAYFDAGYDYDDAERLAEMWRSPGNIGEVKAEAGRRLLTGEGLPFEPTPPSAGSRQSEDSADQRALDAFFAEGYDYEDAVTLAKLWQTDTDQAKVMAGRKLLDGESLPVQR